MRTINTFDGGLDQDTNKLFQKSNTYVDANNIRITTYEGSSNVSITNIKGNSLLTSIPDTTWVYKVTALAGFTGTTTVTITVNTIPVLITTITESIENLANAINSHPAFSSFKAHLSQDKSFFLFTAIDGTTLTTFGIASSTGGVNIVPYTSPQTNLIPIGWTTIRDEI